MLFYLIRLSITVSTVCLFIIIIIIMAASAELHVLDSNPCGLSCMRGARLRWSHQYHPGWIKNYFCNRVQYVEYDGTSSSPRKIKCGVQQGSILGPLFFLIYINDLCNASNVIDLVLFADDTNLFFSHNDLSYLMDTINSEMIQLSNWSLANKLSINVKKSNFMIFKPRQNRQKIDLKIEINSYRIEKVREVVFLGVILDEHISWKPHTSHIASKISKLIGIIFRSSFYLSKRALLTLYYSRVLPYIQ